MQSGEARFIATASYVAAETRSETLFIEGQEPRALSQLMYMVQRPAEADSWTTHPQLPRTGE
ncbi:hypothetical protein Pd630_LPD07457 [Rhodococcus opacus PD630]|nr:hypothetical protein Pd630_LPD07457 [Rhodococcus opacus PD630]